MKDVYRIGKENALHNFPGSIWISPSELRNHIWK